MAVAESWGRSLAEERQSSSLDRIVVLIASALASSLIRCLHASMRWSRDGEQSVIRMYESGTPFVLAFYHDQILLMTYSYRGRTWGRRLSVLSSRHRDGEYVARTLERFGHSMVRGSTGRGGLSGLREMIRHLRRGHDAAFAVDGPRGPRHEVQPGAIEAARLTGAPIVPVAFAASRKRLLRSWDRFQVPYPFGRGVFVFGEPVQVSARAGRSEMESSRRVLQDRLCLATSRAERLARSPRRVTGSDERPGAESEDGSPRETRRSVVR
jgi:lysophospholipid acyltransferase (LPLAT)-like uncharacterized protein